MSPRDSIASTGGNIPRHASPRDSITSTGGRKQPEIKEIKYEIIKIAANSKSKEGKYIVVASHTPRNISKTNTSRMG